MTTRKSVVLLVSLLIFVLLPTVASAEEITFINLGEAEGVELDKSWEINFNDEVVAESVNRDNIVVAGPGLEKENRPTPYLKDKDTIIVPAPEEGYQPGERYTIFVGKDTLEFKSGLKMNDRYKKSFITKGDKVRPSTPPSDVISIGTVTSDTLNVRKGPSSSTERLGVYAKGAEVEIYNVDGYWAEIKYNGQTAYMHKTYMKLRSTSGGVLKDQIIVLDPGHGDGDSGAQSHGGQEKEINLDVTKRVYDRLKAMGAKPIMTRNSDTFLELSERVEFADRNYGDIFVSIHTNAYLPSARGTETFCYEGKSSNVEEGCLLAEKIQEQIVKMVGMYDRGVVRGDRGKFGDFHVIRNTSTPSVLVELGFLTNDGDAKKLMSSYYRDLYAKAVTTGIENYFKAEVK